MAGAAWQAPRPRPTPRSWASWTGTGPPSRRASRRWWPAPRRGAALGMRLLYGVRYTDMCAFRAIRRDLLLGLGLREMTYGWNIEMEMRPARAGLRIREVPVSYRRRTGGASKVAGSPSGSLRAAARIVATFARVSSRPVTARDFSARARDA